MDAHEIVCSPRFNPRAREGRDKLTGKKPDMSDVSIHAPVKGATVMTLNERTTTMFQSTRP